MDFLTVIYEMVMKHDDLMLQLSAEYGECRKI
jgi:hypothetical protein